MAHFVETPETVPARLPKLWTTITPRPEFGSERVLNQSCSYRWELFNVVSHFTRRRREEVDSRLLVVGSQTASLTPDPSFAHNLGCICPNDQCKAIFDIYVSRPFQCTKNASIRGVLSLAVELWTFGSPGGLQTSNFSKCWASPPHLAKVRLRHSRWTPETSGSNCRGQNPMDCDVHYIIGKLLKHRCLKWACIA